MRMTLKAFCEKHGFSYRGMQDRAAKGEFPHSGGGKKGSLVYVFEDTLLDFFRRQDEENARKKAEAINQAKCRPPSTKRYRKKNQISAADSWAEELRRGIAERKAERAAQELTDKAV